MRTDHCFLQATMVGSQGASLSWILLPESSSPTPWASQTPTSTVNTMTSCCRRLLRSCISQELWQLSLLATSQPNMVELGQITTTSFRSTRMHDACINCCKAALAFQLVIANTMHRCRVKPVFANTMHTVMCMFTRCGSAAGP